MAKISSTIELQDRMTQVLNRINRSLNTMSLNLNDVNDSIKQGFNNDQVDQFRNATEDAQSAVIELKNAINEIGAGGFAPLTQGALTMATTVGSIAGNIITKIGFRVIQSVISMIDDSIELYKADTNAQTQLAATLSNTSENAVQSYDRILDKAQEISDSGMYSKGSMVAAGAEFATYFSDNDAIDMMMSTLSDYAAGMSGGGAIDNQQMVDYATNIAKMTTGAYDAMTKKGFEVTDTQKAILKGTATQAQLVAELGEEYKTMSDDMQKATVINSIIAESWDGMYEAMSDTPEGQVLSLTNQFRELMSVSGGELLSSFNQVYDVIRNNWSTVKMIIEGIVSAIRVVISVIAVAINYILIGIQKIADFFNAHGQAILNTVVDIVGIIMGVLNVLKTAFTNLIADLQAGFWGLLETVMNIVSSIAKALNILPFIDIDVEGLVEQADAYRQKREDAWNSRVDYNDAYNSANQWAHDMANKLGTFVQNATEPLNDENSFFNKNMSETAINTGSAAKSLEKSSEELAYLKDYAEQEVINRFTTAEIKVDMGGISQNISKDTDADEVVDHLVGALEKSMFAVAEGAY